MTRFPKISLLFLRLAMGWMFFYAGITKLLNPNWSAAEYIKGAKTFAGLYHLFLQPDVLPVINFVNEWGLTLLGLSLLSGLFVRLSSSLGIVIMLFYYLPILQFPYPNPSSFLVDQHIIFIFVLLFFASIKRKINVQSN